MNNLQEKQVLVLEPSTNTHSLTADHIESEVLSELDGIKMKITGKGLVLHGEHGVIVTEESNVIKLVQQEYNPITKQMQKVTD